MLREYVRVSLLRKGRFFAALVCVCLSLLFLIPGTLPGTQPPLRYPPNAQKIVYYVPQFSDFQQISVHEMHFLKQVLKDAEENNVMAVIFEIDTPGGQVDVALKYVSVLSKSKVPTVAFVNPQGISAGMIIALAADRAVINPQGTIGDAMPMQMTRQGYRPLTDKDDAQAVDEKAPDKKDAGKESGDDAAADAEPGDEDAADEDDKKPAKPGLGRSVQEQLDQIRRLVEELDKDRQDEGLTPEEKKLADRKFLTSYFKVLQVLAEKNNRPVSVVRAMADPYQKLSKEADGIDHVKVSPLTLSALEAKELGVVDFICRDKNEVKSALGLEDCRIVIKDKSPTHYLIFLLSHPFISGLLIILGIIGLYIEARTPGFGLPGSIGVAAMVLFFIGHAGVGNSDWVPAAIFFIGIILLALEIFVIPGFGIAGISGIIAIVASLLLAFGWNRIELALNTVGIAMILATIIIVILTFYVLPKSALFSKITLQHSQDNADGYSSHDKPSEDLVGKEGVVHSTLRPAGLAIIDGKRLDVLAEAEFIDKGEKVKVVKVDGMRITVNKA